MVWGGLEVVSCGLDMFWGGLGYVIPINYRRHVCQRSSSSSSSSSSSPSSSSSSVY